MQFFTSIRFAVGCAAVLVLSFSASALPVELPGECERRLSIVRGPRSTAESPAEWTSLITHLDELGYGKAWIPHLLETARFDEAELLSAIRHATGRNGWLWGDAMTSAFSARLRIHDGAPLEYLTEVPGFNAAAAVLGHLFDPTFNRSPQLVKHYAQRASLWAGGHLGEAAVLKLFSLITDSEEMALTASWMLRVLPFADHPPIHRALFERLTEVRAENGDLVAQEFLFQYTHIYPLVHLSTADGPRLAKNWFRLEQYPPLRSNHVRTASYGVNRANDCEWMTMGYLRVLLGLPPRTAKDRKRVKEELGTPILVRLNGRLVGLIKAEGDDSMLALRSLLNDDGRLMLVVGGVYRVSPEFVRNRYPEDPVTGWPVANVDRLAAFPLSLMTNRNVWSEPAVLPFINLLGLASDRPASRGRLHRRAWTRVLSLIDQLRRRIDPD